MPPKSTQSNSSLRSFVLMGFRDQMKVGADGQKRLRLIGKED
jgi:hypothetical protein